MKSDELWSILLQLQTKIRGFSEDISFCHCSKSAVLINKKIPNVSGDNFYITLNDDTDLPIEATVFKLRHFIKTEHQQGKTLSPENIAFLKVYLPYCFLSHKAQQIKRCITVAHFAQSLDGKIATDQGDSRWIGNDENLKHAHRMRALCDGIMVGNNTVKNDQPKLTVRKVEGQNPLRIIIGASKVDLSSLMACSPDTILVVSNEATYDSPQVEHLRIPSGNCQINRSKLLSLLYERGVHSLYIEGGAVTTSGFLKEGIVDVLQLHIAPLIFGSGKQGIVLPKIEEVTESQQFSQFDFYKVGDSMMFVGAI